MNTTHGSSFEYQSGLEWSVPSRWQQQLFRDLDELQRYRAAQQPAPDPDKAKKAAKIARMAHAREYHTMRLEAAMEDLVHDHQLQLPLLLWKSRRSRAEWAQKQIHGEYVPSWRTIDDYLKTLSL
ncbi:hypothetical protein JFU47_32130 [Pseudomonas sp. TH39(2020)]|uniref:hypothetical protein n=1 Tax=Pseudomonas sp. TH39(2020) TaxID=2796349 RepID=UPI0019139B1E|nr:hypothetical protein [Pseudomonas sp. TH39(2020)]MBK5401326.1 hypothetical protein [Pseudomonas sp. TH39(2020)]